MWYSFKMWKHRYIGMYPHCLDNRFLNILMYPHYHHYIGMYLNFPGIGHLSMFMYPHCRLYIGMYPYSLESRFLGKLMYPHCLFLYRAVSTLPVYRIVSTCLGYKKSVWAETVTE